MSQEIVRNAARIAEELEGTEKVYRITRGGRGSMVLMSEEHFQGWMAVMEEMQRPNWRQHLEEARRDAAAGRGRTLDEVVKELGLDAPPHPARRGPARRAPGVGGAKGGKGVARARGRTA